MVRDAPYHYACDSRWWDLHYDDVRDSFTGISYTINDLDNPHRNPDQKYKLERINSKQEKDLGEEMIHYGVSGGGNSGFQAVNLAYILGAKTILLLGFDMFGDHYFGRHPSILDVASPFGKFIESFETITKDVEIINCSRMTNLNCFPKKRIDQIL